MDVKMIHQGEEIHAYNTGAVRPLPRETEEISVEGVEYTVERVKHVFPPKDIYNLYVEIHLIKRERSVNFGYTKSITPSGKTIYSCNATGRFFDEIAEDYGDREER